MKKHPFSKSKDKIRNISIWQEEIQYSDSFSEDAEYKDNYDPYERGSKRKVIDSYIRFWK